MLHEIKSELAGAKIVSTPIGQLKDAQTSKALTSTAKAVDIISEAL